MRAFPKQRPWAGAAAIVGLALFSISNTDSAFAGGEPKQARSASPSTDPSHVDLCAMPGVCPLTRGGYWLYFPVPTEGTHLTLTIGKDENGSPNYSIEGHRNGEPVDLIGSVDWSNPVNPIFEPALPNYLTGEGELAYGVVGAFLPSVNAAFQSTPPSGTTVEEFVLVIDFSAGPDPQAQANASPFVGVEYEIRASVAGRDVSGPVEDSPAANTLSLPGGRTITCRFYDQTESPIDSAEARKRYETQLEGVADRLGNFQKVKTVYRFPVAIDDRPSPRDTRWDNFGTLMQDGRLTPAQVKDWALGTLSATDFRKVVGTLLRDVEVTVSNTATVQIGVPGVGQVTVSSTVTVKGPESERTHLVDVAADVVADAADKAATKVKEKLDEMVEKFKKAIHEKPWWFWFSIY